MESFLLGMLTKIRWKVSGTEIRERDFYHGLKNLVASFLHHVPAVPLFNWEVTKWLILLFTDALYVGILFRREISGN